MAMVPYCLDALNCVSVETHATMRCRVTGQILIDSPLAWMRSLSVWREVPCLPRWVLLACVLTGWWLAWWVPLNWKTKLAILVTTNRSVSDVVIAQLKNNSERLGVGRASTSDSCRSGKPGLPSLPRNHQAKSHGVLLLPNCTISPNDSASNGPRR